MIYDVAIIGGGIAGLALSIDLKKKGYNILVIESGNYPRHKVCGEYISLESQNYLHSLCPSLKEINLPVIKKFKLTSGTFKKFETVLDLGGFGISRYLLEDYLFTEAKNQGVVFKLNTKARDIVCKNEVFTIIAGEENYGATFVCNASGRKSNLEVKEKNNPGKETNYVGVKYHLKLKRDAELIEIHNFDGGYCGISNIEDDTSCLCYIVNSKMLKAANNSIPALEKEVLFKNVHLKKIFTEAEFIFPDPLTISGINFRIKRQVNEKIFFLGDSAGSIAPITGNGMSIGLRAASVLAKNIDECFSKKINRQQLETNYTIFWNDQFSTRIKLSRHFQKLSEYPALTKMTIDLFNLFPVLAKTIIKQTHGQPF